MALELRRVQMPLRPASPASDKFMSPSAQKLRFFHATLFTGLPPELRRGKSSTGYGDVVRGVALRGCKQKQDAHCKRMLVAVMLHSCTITERPHFCASLKNFSRLQDGRNCDTVCNKNQRLFSVQSRKSTRKYPHAWQVSSFAGVCYTQTQNPSASQDADLLPLNPAPAT